MELGELCALGAALVWAAAVILFRKSGETTAPFALNLYRVGVSGVLLTSVAVIAGEPLLAGRSASDLGWLALSGIIGIALSDTLFHRCLNMVGAGLNAIVDCLYSPFVAVFAFALLGERLGPWQLGGMAFVVGGVLITSKAIPPAGSTTRDLVVGILWGTGAMATLALGVILAKPVLETSSVLWASAIRQIASFAVMAPVALALPDRRRVWSVFRPNPSWRYTLPGTVLGSFLALLLWLAGMKLTEAGKAAILNQTSTIFILVLASLFLREPFTARRWLAAGLAIAGILMVTFG
jgi:drug/metabolite transporter (DMT)-like permease